MAALRCRQDMGRTAPKIVCTPFVCDQRITLDCT